MPQYNYGEEPSDVRLSDPCVAWVLLEVGDDIRTRPMSQVLHAGYCEPTILLFTFVKSWKRTLEHFEPPKRSN